MVLRTTNFQYYLFRSMTLSGLLIVRCRCGPFPFCAGLFRHRFPLWIWFLPSS